MCVDGWSKRGLKSSFLVCLNVFNISLCLKHALLNLHRLEHPHTSEVITHCIDLTLEAWKITADKVLLIVMDNSSNIVKTTSLLRERGGDDDCLLQHFGSTEEEDCLCSDTEAETSETELEESV